MICHRTGMPWLVASILLCLFPAAAAGGVGEKDCPELLSSGSEAEGVLTPDLRLSAYLTDLADAGVLGVEALEGWMASLEEGRMENPVTEKLARMSHEAQVHRDSLERHVRGEVTVSSQLEWVRGRLEEMGRNRESRAVTEVKTREIPLDEILPGARMIPLAGGNFTMGSPRGERGRGGDEDRVEVGLSPFGIMDAPVTQRQWHAVTGGNPSRFRGKEDCEKSHVVIGGIPLCPEHPVEGVSWYDVQEFLKRLNGKLGITEEGKKYGLPTEAQWEYAARGGTETAYSFGDDPKDLERYAVTGGGGTRPVRTRKPNPFGLYDVHGNVWEWVRDTYHGKLPGGRDPLQSAPSNFRVVRGGSWVNGPRNLRSAYRIGDNPEGRFSNVGFRIMRTL